MSVQSSFLWFFNLWGPVPVLVLSNFDKRPDWTGLPSTNIYINDAVGLHTAYGVKCCVSNSVCHNCDSCGHVVLCQHSPSSSAMLVLVMSMGSPGVIFGWPWQYCAQHCVCKDPEGSESQENTKQVQMNSFSEQEDGWTHRMGRKMGRRTGGLGLCMVLCLRESRWFRK